MLAALGGQNLLAIGKDLWRAFRRVEGWLAWPLILLIRGYKLFVSPALPPACKYHPSCSAYADEALCRHGLVCGSLLMTWRLCRCNPLSRGGYDPVPGTEESRRLRFARRGDEPRPTSTRDLGRIVRVRSVRSVQRAESHTLHPLEERP